MAEKETRLLYDRDFLQWTARTAQLLREGRISEVDIEHVAEEIEDMGKGDRRALESQLERLIVHLLKHELQPSRRGTSWNATMVDSRNQIGRLFRDSPSLRPMVGALVCDVYAAAVRSAAAETGLDRGCFPSRCPYTPEQLMNDDFWPE